jgi:hypothetical protein
MSNLPARQERIIYDLPASEYHATPGLSHSAMKDLIISPMRFWHNHVRPDREPQEETDFMIFGRALHSAVLDTPEVFDAQFCCEYVAPPDALEKSDDIKQWIKDNGGKPTGTVKSAPGGWIDQALAIDPHVVILEREQRRHFARNEGKHILKSEDWSRLAGCAKALMDEPEFQRLRAVGRSEVSYFVTDPDTGVPLKARMDFVAPKWTLDPKTFSQKGKPIDRTVADAIYFEGYYRQAYLYTTIREIAGEGKTDFINPFVESEEPHEVRIRRHNQTSLLWEVGRSEVIRLIRLYASLMDRFGTDRPWRTNATVDDLMDEEIKGLAWT